MSTERNRRSRKLPADLTSQKVGFLTVVIDSGSIRHTASGKGTYSIVLCNVIVDHRLYGLDGVSYCGKRCAAVAVENSSAIYLGMDME